MSSSAIHWKRGMFRLWVAGSVAWIIFVGGYTWQTVEVPRERAASQAVCASKRAANPKLGNPFDCFEPGSDIFADLMPIGPALGTATAVALLPPVGALMVWWVGAWVVGGFRRWQD